MKNQSKNEPKIEQHESIDFYVIFIDFRPQVGSQKRPKTPKKRFKMASKNEAFFRHVFEALQDDQELPGGGEHSGAVGGPEILDPLNDQKSKKITKVTK